MNPSLSSLRLQIQMEVAFSLSSTSLPLPSHFLRKPLPKLAIPSLSSKRLSKSQCLHIAVGKERRRTTSLRSSFIEATSKSSSERWLLEPVGNGDSRHIGFRVPLPSAFEISSDVVTVGRLPEKADMVIPVATVSGLHARLEKKEGKLFVTDLDSTNGTFIGDKRLFPGAIASVSPGDCIIFGDANLAIFRVSKIDASKLEESDTKVDTKVDVDAASVNLESAG